MHNINTLNFAYITNENSETEVLIDLKQHLTKSGAYITLFNIYKDTSIENVNDNHLFNDFSGYFFIDDNTSEQVKDNSLIQILIREALKSNRIIILTGKCPEILSRANLAQGRHITADESLRAELEQKGAIFTGDDLTIDENLITAKDNSQIEAICNIIIEIVQNEEAA